MKFSKQTLLLNKANKIFKTGYGLNRDLASSEIVLEAKNLLRKNEKGNLDDMQERMFFQLEKEEWQKVVDN